MVECIEIIKLTPAEKSLLIGVLAAFLSTNLTKEEATVVGDFLVAVGSTLVSAVDQQ